MRLNLEYKNVNVFLLKVTGKHDEFFSSVDIEHEIVTEQFISCFFCYFSTICLFH